MFGWTVPPLTSGVFSSGPETGQTPPITVAKLRGRILCGTLYPVTITRHSSVRKTLVGIIRLYILQRMRHFLPRFIALQQPANVAQKS